MLSVPSIESLAKRRSSVKEATVGIHTSVSKGLYKTSSLSSLKSLGLKRPFTGDEGQSPLLTFFQRRNSSKAAAEDRRPSEEDIMADLDAQFARIRGDLDAMRREGKAFAARVQDVNSQIDSVVTSRHSSLDVITESTTTTSIELEKSASTTDDRDSMRDSGCVFDLVFEVDTRKISIPNNLHVLCNNSTSLLKKTRSTSSLDFIKNDLHDNKSASLKATSYDRLSCYSDTALISCRRHK